MADTINRHYEITIIDEPQLPPVSYDTNKSNVETSKYLSDSEEEDFYVPKLEGLSPPRTAHVSIDLSAEKYSKK